VVVALAAETVTAVAVMQATMMAVPDRRQSTG